MSQKKQCPFCRRAIRMNDKFCPFCGRYVLDAVPQQRTAPQTSHSPPAYPPQSTVDSSAYNQPEGTPYPPGEASGTAPPAMAPSVPEAPEPELSAEIMDQIALRVDLEALDNSMTEIKKKLEELGEIVSKTEITSDIELKIKNLKEQIKGIKAKREKLLVEKQDLPFEAELTKKKDIQERLAKLNEAYRAKKVTDAAFKKLRAEYERTLQEIDSKSRLFKQRINTWVKNLKGERDKVQEQVELLEARFVAGELTQDHYNTQKEENTEKLNRYNNVIKFLSEKI